MTSRWKPNINFGGMCQFAFEEAEEERCIVYHMLSRLKIGYDIVKGHAMWYRESLRLIRNGYTDFNSKKRLFLKIKAVKNKHDRKSKKDIN